jgi:hypothetical protein
LKKIGGNWEIINLKNIDDLEKNHDKEYLDIDEAIR